jgi:hypothetical protein
MRKFWFAVSLAMIFMFAFSTSYIYMALAGGESAVDEVDKPYMVASRPASELQMAVKTVQAEDTVTVREEYALCGHVEEQILADGGSFLGRSYDELGAEGWNVAETGENELELARELDGLCPQDAERRVIMRTERGIAVYSGTAEHPGSLLLEMPVDFAELPPEMLGAFDKGGFELATPEELDEVLESLDELVSMQDVEEVEDVQE